MSADTVRIHRHVRHDSEMSNESNDPNDSFRSDGDSSIHRDRESQPRHQESHPRLSEILDVNSDEDDANYHSGPLTMRRGHTDVIESVAPMGGESKETNENNFEMKMTEMAKASQLCIVSDVDGTIVELAAHPDLAFPSEHTKKILHNLHNLSGVSVYVVSGRPKSTMAAWFKDYPTINLVAEHGAWVRTDGDWKLGFSTDTSLLDQIEETLKEIASRYPGTLVERKTVGLGFHTRLVRENREKLMTELNTVVDKFVEEHPEFGRMDGKQLIEIRLKVANKGKTVLDIQHSLPDTRMLILGDDTTDEDMFREAKRTDVCIVVGEVDRPTLANFNVTSVADTVCVLQWIFQFRAGQQPLVELKTVRSTPAADLLIISNRHPSVTEFSRKQNVGGLVSALQSVFATTAAVWLGWSGKLSDSKEVEVSNSMPCLASFDMPDNMKEGFYDVACNGLLWPLLHSMQERMLKLYDNEFEVYGRANMMFAQTAVRLVTRQTPVWVHDYHLMLVALYLRQLGHLGPIGFFLHVPFPSPDLFFILSWAEELMIALFSYSLVGFHIQSYADNFLQCAQTIKGVTVDDNVIYYNDKKCTVGVYPVGIEPEVFAYPHPSPPPDLVNLLETIRGRKLVLGVERLDYTKGLLKRLRSIRSLFHNYPQWRRNVVFVQVCVPSRVEVSEYDKLRTDVEALAGNINGEFSDLDWIPLRLIMHGFPPSTLAALYEKADVMLVTPNRDGMNLVAMEYIAAQNPASPGVLLLSRFAGIATLFPDGLLTNPYHVEGMTKDLDRALTMSLPERLKIHTSLWKVVKFRTAKRWADTFMQALATSSQQEMKSPSHYSAMLRSDPLVPSLKHLEHYISRTWQKLSFDLNENTPKGNKSIVYVPETDDIEKVKAQLLAKGSTAEVRPFTRGSLSQEELARGLLYLPNPYVVPGEQFSEMYGWDSFFIVLGLLQDGNIDQAKGIVDNFCYEIQHYGKVLNCNRAWAARRSQPPLLSQMALAVFTYTKDKQWLRIVLNCLVQSYRRWTSEPYLVPSIGLSRYYSEEEEGPAPEVLLGERDSNGRSYYDRVGNFFRQRDVDCNTQSIFDRQTNELSPSFYKEDRSMRESGLDSSHLFGPFGCETTSYIPVCLNTMLYQLEATIAHLHEVLDLSSNKDWLTLAKTRAGLIDKYLWDADAGLYFNYNFVTQRRRRYPFATTFYPLWAGIASREQALAVKENLHLFEESGGIVTSTAATGCKWDAPFGLAPLQYFAVMGLSRYQFSEDAKRIALKFVATVARGLEKHGSLYDVYNVRYGTTDVERDLQFSSRQQESGFGWTNGVVREFLALFQLPRLQKGARLGGNRSP